MDVEAEMQVRKEGGRQAYMQAYMQADRQAGARRMEPVQSTSTLSDEWPSCLHYDLRLCLRNTSRQSSSLSFGLLQSYSEFLNVV